MAQAAPGRSPRKQTAKDPEPRQKKAQKAPAAKRRERRPRPTRGERTLARAERRRQRQAHRAGMRAIWRDRWVRTSDWFWPPTTRDIGRRKAILVLLLNIAPFPGLGTILYGQVARGIAQFVLTFVFLIGWVWAILDGVRILRRADRGPDPRRGPQRGRTSLGGARSGRP